jgi:hypothetical protein
MGPVLFGALLGLLVGKLSMIISYYNNILSSTRLKLRIFGSLGKKIWHTNLI